MTRRRLRKGYESIKAESPTAYFHYTLSEDEKKLVELGLQFMIEQGLLQKKFTIKELFTDTVERLERGGR